MSMLVHSDSVASLLLRLQIKAIYAAPALATFIIILAFVHGLRYYRQAGSKSSERLSVLVLPLSRVLNTISFLLNREDFVRGLLSRRRVSPVYIGLCGYGIYLAVPGEQVRELLRSSHLVPSPGLSDALRNFFGLPKSDLRVFDHDHISYYESTAAMKTSHPDPSRRIMTHQRKDFALYFQGRHLRLTVKRSIANLVSSLRDDASLDRQPSHIPDVYRFLFSHIFCAEARALYGETIFMMSPSFCEDFMCFYEAFPNITSGLPRWLSPSSYRARDAMISHFKAWRTMCSSRSELGEAQRRGEDYEPIWGSTCIRNMVRRHEDLGFSDDGIASVMLGYLFVTMANSIPATLWMLLYILLDDDLLSRVHAELKCAFSGPSVLDVEKLMGLPLLNSVYRETLRLRIAGAVGRRRPDGEMRLGGAKVKRNTVVMFSNWLGGQQDSFWNSCAVLGDLKERPVGEFWAERFLGLGNCTPEPGNPKKLGDQHQGGLAPIDYRGYWFPFGGGPSRCPGENLAKHMILSCVAALIGNFHIQLSDPAAAHRLRSSHCTLPFGSHDPDGPVRVAVRQRRLLSSEEEFRRGRGA